MKIAIVGSRTITDIKKVEMALAECPWYRPSAFAGDTYTFVSGGADGVDTLAEEVADKHTDGLGPLTVETDVVKPDWDDWSEGHPAKVRNTEIIERADAVVAVWDGKSTGTRDSIDKALDRGKPLYVRVVNDGEDDN